MHYIPGAKDFLQTVLLWITPIKANQCQRSIVEKETAHLPAQKEVGRASLIYIPATAKTQIKHLYKETCNGGRVSGLALKT